MIIWGSRGREIEQERGEFQCPQCSMPQDYKKMRVATYFTLYFIPLFEMQYHGDFIECLGCGEQFNPTVLDYVPPTRGEQLANAIRADLESGTPLQMAQTKLTNQGLEPSMAEKLVSATAGNTRQTCNVCNLSFISSVQRCSTCGGSLRQELGYSEPILDALPADDSDQ